MSEETVKRPVGRPRKNPLPVEDAKAQPKAQHKMRAKPNWEDAETLGDDSPDRLKVPADMVPEGMSLQWVTTTVYGQPQPQRRATFERKGWTPVHQDDFDGQFDGMFMPKGAPGEITVEGLVLMARPKEFTEKATKLEKRAANEQVMIKENSLRGGDINTRLDSQHESALRSNRINKTVERLDIPDR